MSLVLHCLPRLLLIQMLLLKLEMYVIIVTIIMLKLEWKSNRSENTLLQIMPKLSDNYFYSMIQFLLIIGIFQ